MNGNSPIVVGVDFSEPSRRAVEVASALSDRTGAALVLLHVWNANHLAGSGRILPQLENWIAEQKAALVEQLEEWARAAGGSAGKVTARVVEGVASRMIPEQALSLRAGLVVVGRRGAANLAHVLLGSVSERVVHQAPCPVLVVPGRGARGSPPGRLLVGIDFSQASKDAYRAARGLAEQLGAERGLVLVHVRPSQSALLLESGVDLSYRGEYPYDRDALERWAKPADTLRIPLDCRVLDGRTEDLLVSATEQEGCDWLVMGLQGRTALAAFLIGSTTDRVLKLASCPVLVVPMTSESAGEPTS